MQGGECGRSETELHTLGGAADSITLPPSPSSSADEAPKMEGRDGVGVPTVCVGNTSAGSALKVGNGGDASTSFFLRDDLSLSFSSSSFLTSSLLRVSVLSPFSSSTVFPPSSLSPTSLLAPFFSCAEEEEDEEEEGAEGIKGRAFAFSRDCNKLGVLDRDESPDAGVVGGF